MKCPKCGHKFHPAERTGYHGQYKDKIQQIEELFRQDYRLSDIARVVGLKTHGNLSEIDSSTVRYILEKQGHTVPPQSPSRDEMAARRQKALALRKAGKTFKQIGNELGFSASRASEIVARAERDNRREQTRTDTCKTFENG